MSGRHKFSDIEAAMPSARRARIARLADKLDKDMARASNRDARPVPAEGGESPKARLPQARAARSGAAG